MKTLTRNDLSEMMKLMCVDDEVLYEAYILKGNGAEILGITDLRLIFMDQGLMPAKKLLNSLLLTKITMVAFEDNGEFNHWHRELVFEASQLVVSTDKRVLEFEFISPYEAHEAYRQILQLLMDANDRE